MRVRVGEVQLYFVPVPLQDDDKAVVSAFRGEQAVQLAEGGEVFLIVAAAPEGDVKDAGRVRHVWRWRRWWRVRRQLWW